jgi:hypothetical protein
MRRFLVGFIAAVLVVSFIVGASMALSSGRTPTATATSTMVAGPVNGKLLPSGNGGHVACPNNQPCGEVGSSRP